MCVAGDANGTGIALAMAASFNVLFQGYAAGESFDDVPVLTPQTLYWAAYSSANAVNRMDITGWQYGGNLG
jgi:hypothetical protein